MSGDDKIGKCLTMIGYSAYQIDLSIKHWGVWDEKYNPTGFKGDVRSAMAEADRLNIENGKPRRYVGTRPSQS